MDNRLSGLDELAFSLKPEITRNSENFNAYLSGRESSKNYLFLYNSNKILQSVVEGVLSPIYFFPKGESFLSNVQNKFKRKQYSLLRREVEKRNNIKEYTNNESFGIGRSMGKLYNLLRSATISLGSLIALVI